MNETTTGPWTDDDVKAAGLAAVMRDNAEATGDAWDEDVRAILNWAFTSPRVAELQRAAKVAALRQAALILANEANDERCRVWPDMTHDDGCGGAGLDCAARLLVTRADEIEQGTPAVPVPQPQETP